MCIDFPRCVFFLALSRIENMLNNENCSIVLGWFELPDEKNCNVYVTGLPLDITDLEFEEMMSKYGIISPDPNDSRKKKIRLYRDEQGQAKGDGRCRYVRVSFFRESVG